MIVCPELSFLRLQMDCYIGLDIGTTNSKAIALRRDGTTEIIYEQKQKIS